MAEKNGNGCTNEPEPARVADIKPSSIIKEFRIPMPLSSDEYHIAQLYSVAEASKNETGGGEGIEVLENRPITDAELDLLPFKQQLLDIAAEKGDAKIGGQYTHKRFYLASKVPNVVRYLAPNKSLEVDEKAWNCYPYCRTEYSNEYMGDAFHLVIETMHKNDDGTTPNIHNLDQKDLIKRQVTLIDIADSKKARENKDYKPDEDPNVFQSTKTGRGPLEPPAPVPNTAKPGQQYTPPDWVPKQNPIMCCYKLYKILFKWKLLQGKVESVLVRGVERILYNFHRQVFCWIDLWHGMTIEDIRDLEAKTKKNLDELREAGPVRGTTQSS